MWEKIKYIGLALAGSAMIGNYGCVTARCLEWRGTEKGLERDICDFQGRLNGIEHKTKDGKHYYIMVGDRGATMIRAEDMRDVNQNGVLDLEDAVTILRGLGVNKKNMMEYLTKGKNYLKR